MKNRARVALLVVALLAGCRSIDEHRFEDFRRGEALGPFDLDEIPRASELGPWLEALRGDGRIAGFETFPASHSFEIQFRPDHPEARGVTVFVYNDPDRPSRAHALLWKPRELPAGDAATQARALGLVLRGPIVSSREWGWVHETDAADLAVPVRDDGDGPRVLGVLQLRDRDTFFKTFCQGKAWTEIRGHFERSLARDDLEGARDDVPAILGLPPTDETKELVARFDEVVTQAAEARLVKIAGESLEASLARAKVAVELPTARGRVVGVLCSWLDAALGEAPGQLERAGAPRSVVEYARGHAVLRKAFADRLAPVAYARAVSRLFTLAAALTRVEGDALETECARYAALAHARVLAATDPERALLDELAVERHLHLISSLSTEAARQEKARRPGTAAGLWVLLAHLVPDKREKIRKEKLLPLVTPLIERVLPAIETPENELLARHADELFATEGLLRMPVLEESGYRAAARAGGRPSVTVRAGPLRFERFAEKRETTTRKTTYYRQELLPNPDLARWHATREKLLAEKAQWSAGASTSSAPDAGTRSPEAPRTPNNGWGAIQYVVEDRNTGAYTVVRQGNLMSGPTGADAFAARCANESHSSFDPSQFVGLRGPAEIDRDLVAHDASKPPEKTLQSVPVSARYEVEQQRWEGVAKRDLVGREVDGDRTFTVEQVEELWKPELIRERIGADPEKNVAAKDQLWTKEQLVACVQARLDARIYGDLAELVADRASRTIDDVVAEVPGSEEERAREESWLRWFFAARFRGATWPTVPRVDPVFDGPPPSGPETSGSAARPIAPTPVTVRRTAKVRLDAPGIRQPAGIAWLADGHRLVVKTGAEATDGIYAATGHRLRPLEYVGLVGRPRVAAHPHGRGFVVAEASELRGYDEEGHVVWRTDIAKWVEELGEVRYSRDGRFVAVPFKDKSRPVWDELVLDTTTLRPAPRERAPRALEGLAIVRDGVRTAVVQEESRRLVKYLASDVFAPFADSPPIASPEGVRLLVGEKDKVLVESLVGDPVALDGPWLDARKIDRTSWAADGRRLAIAHDGERVHVVDTFTGHVVAQLELPVEAGPKARLEDLALSPDGRTLAFTTWEEGAKVSLLHVYRIEP